MSQVDCRFKVRCVVRRVVFFLYLSLLVSCYDLVFVAQASRSEHVLIPKSEDLFPPEGGKTPTPNPKPQTP